MPEVFAISVSELSLRISRACASALAREERAPFVFESRKLVRSSLLGILARCCPQELNKRAGVLHFLSYLSPSLSPPPQPSSTDAIPPTDHCDSEETTDLKRSDSPLERQGE